MNSQEQGVAEQLADEQRQTSIAEFFEKNKQMLGFGSNTRAIVTAVKEGVDNSLDAAEEARILPDIAVNIDKNDQFYTVSIEDNGPGIPRESIPNVFGKLLYGSRFHRRMQQRGQQGIGISAAVLYSQLTSGNPARITSKTADSDTAYYIEMGIDTDENQPVINVDKEIDWEKEHGIKIELDMEGNMRGRSRLHRYIESTAVVNPHATIELHEPENDLVYDERVVDELPSEVEEIKPHPHGVELGTLRDMMEATNSRELNSFFKTEFTRVGGKTAEGILDNFRDTQYGRALSWYISGEEVSKEDYVEAVLDVVNGKGEEATTEFAELMYENLSQKDYASRVDVFDAVEQAAEGAEESTGKQFASTVQEKAVDAVWDVVLQNRRDCTLERVKEVTIDRKEDELLEEFAEAFVNVLEERDSLTMTTDAGMEEIVGIAGSRAEDEATSGSFGETAQQKVYDIFWETASRSTQDVPRLSDFSDNRNMAKNLLDAMRRSDAMAPPKKCLSPITEGHIETGLRSKYDADLYTASTRSAKVAEGDPFVVEAGIAYGGEIEPEGQIQLSRFANRVPLVYQQGACAMTKKIKNIRWNNYYKSGDKLSQNSGSLPQGPMVLLIHVASTNVKFTSESKDAVAGVPEIKQEVERAVREVARDVKDHLSSERSRRQRQQKQDVIGGLLADMTDKIESVTDGTIDGKEQSQARILNNLLVNVGSNEVILTNYGGRKQSFEIEVDTDDGTETISGTLEKSESEKFELDSQASSVGISEPDEPRVTIKN